VDYLQAILLGILQGITEFLPVSSSGHLAVAEHFMKLDIPEATLQAFDVMVHVATLAAICIVFRKALIEAFTTRRRLIPLYIAGCIPAGVAGVLLKLYGQGVYNDFKGSLICVGGAFMVTGLVLLLTRFFAPRKRDSQTATMTDAWRVGICQAAALLPGISRSGVTISAGVIGGLTRSFAAQFSFVMAIPLILGAAAVDAKDLFTGEAIPLGMITAGFIAAFITGLLSLFGLVAIVKRGRLWLFALYLLPLGLTLIIYDLIVK
jgi:undecaprenyl-diphosphatase